jgi:hypothetical protein
MADGMTRETWGRIEYLAIMLAGGFEYIESGEMYVRAFGDEEATG